MAFFIRFIGSHFTSFQTQLRQSRPRRLSHCTGPNYFSRMAEREGTKSSAFTAPCLSPSLESSARKKRRSSSASPPRRNNKIFNNIVTEQPRVQMKHYQLESLWKRVSFEVGDQTSGSKSQPHSHRNNLRKLHMLLEISVQMQTSH